MNEKDFGDRRLGTLLIQNIISPHTSLMKTAILELLIQTICNDKILTEALWANDNTKIYECTESLPLSTQTANTQTPFHVLNVIYLSSVSLVCFPCGIRGRRVKSCCLHIKYSA